MTTEIDLDAAKELSGAQHEVRELGPDDECPVDQRERVEDYVDLPRSPNVPRLTSLRSDPPSPPLSTVNSSLVDPMITSPPNDFPRSLSAFKGKSFTMRFAPDTPLSITSPNGYEPSQEEDIDAETGIQEAK